MLRGVGLGGLRVRLKQLQNNIQMTFFQNQVRERERELAKYHVVLTEAILLKGRTRAMRERETERK